MDKGEQIKQGEINVYLLFETLSKVLSESTGTKITYSIKAKDSQQAS